MLWYIPVILKVLTAHVLFPWVSKHVGMKHSIQKRNFLNFSFCALVALLWAIWRGQLVFNETTLFIFGVGIANGLAAYCQWKAISINLSRNSLFTFFDDVIAVSLSCMILHESRFINLLSGTGIAASFLAVVFFAIRDYRKKTETGNSLIPASFYFYVGFYSVVWGVATFLMKLWGVQHISVSTFVCFWYAGAWVGSLSIFVYVKRYHHQINPPFVRRDFGYVGIMGSMMMIALALGYMAYERAPQTIVQPIFLVSEMVLPALIGLWIFNERKGFRMADWFLIGLAIAGGALVAVSYGN